jgi:cytochrome c oxidase subunit 2
MTRGRWFRACALAGGLGAVSGAVPPPQQTPHHQFTVVAHRYAFEPPRLEVHENDLVRITLRTADIPHSFVVDTLRIFKKATPGHDVTFEFLADRTGEFPFYCSLTIEEGCRQMIGRLVVRPERDRD